jgi:hypothetical protein
MSEGYLWAIEDHACRECLGRVLSRLGNDGGVAVRCACCGAQGVGEPAAICACGLSAGGYAGLRCTRLERPVPGIDSEIVATEAGSG